MAILPSAKQAFSIPDKLQDGAGKKVNPDFCPKPDGLVTLTDPVEPAPTIADMVLSFTTVNEAAGVNPNETAVVPVKLAPIIVTT